MYMPKELSKIETVIIFCLSIESFFLINFYFVLCYFFSDVFISSRSEPELTEIYNMLMENLCHVSSALTNMEFGNSVTMKQPPSSPAITPPSKDPSVDIITTL